MEKSEILEILKNIHEEMIDKEDFQATINSLNKLKINGLVKYYLEMSEWNTSIDIEIVEWIIKVLQGIYNNSSDNNDNKSNSNGKISKFFLHFYLLTYIITLNYWISFFIKKIIAIFLGYLR